MATTHETFANGDYITTTVVEYSGYFKQVVSSQIDGIYTYSVQSEHTIGTTTITVDHEIKRGDFGNGYETFESYDYVSDGLFHDVYHSKEIRTHQGSVAHAEVYVAGDIDGTVNVDAEAVLDYDSTGSTSISKTTITGRIDGDIDATASAEILEGDYAHARSTNVSTGVITGDLDLHSDASVDKSEGIGGVAIASNVAAGVIEGDITQDSSADNTGGAHSVAVAVDVAAGAIDGDIVQETDADVSGGTHSVAVAVDVAAGHIDGNIEQDTAAEVSGGTGSVAVAVEVAAGDISGDITQDATADVNDGSHSVAVVTNVSAGIIEDGVDQHGYAEVSGGTGSVAVAVDVAAGIIDGGTVQSAEAEVSGGEHSVSVGVAVAAGVIDDGVHQCVTADTSGGTAVAAVAIDVAAGDIDGGVHQFADADAADGTHVVAVSTNVAVGDIEDGVKQIAEATADAEGGVGIVAVTHNVAAGDLDGGVQQLADSDADATDGSHVVAVAVNVAAGHIDGGTAQIADADASASGGVGIVAVSKNVAAGDIDGEVAQISDASADASGGTGIVAVAVNVAAGGIDGDVTQVADAEADATEGAHVVAVAVNVGAGLIGGDVVQAADADAGTGTAEVDVDTDIDIGVLADGVDQTADAEAGDTGVDPDIEVDAAVTEFDTAFDAHCPPPKSKDTDDDLPTLTITPDDIGIDADGRPELTENGPIGSLLITRSGPTDDPLVVTLSSDDTGEAIVPATVTIPSGASSIDVQISPVDDLLIDGPQFPIITASAPGAAPVSVEVRVNDDDLPTLTLTPVPGAPTDPATGNPLTAENGAPAQIVISRDGPVDQDLVVTLTDGDPTETDAPATVTIPAGSSSVTVDIPSVDDTDVDGPQISTITATAPGTNPGSIDVTVADDDVPADPLLTIEAGPNTPTDADGNPVTIENGDPVEIVITRNGPTDDPLTVFLFSGDTTEASVMTPVIIPAGESSVTTLVSPVDDTIIDGPQTPTIFAFATGFPMAMQDVVVEDDDAPVQTGTVSGRLWCDEDGNGIEDPLEPGIEGVTVQLRDADDGFVTVATAVTDADGRYSFANVDPGNYCVFFEDEDPGTIWTANGVGGAATDSNVIEAFQNGPGETNIFTVVSGGNVKDIDGGVIKIPANAAPVAEDDREGPIINRDLVDTDQNPVVVTASDNALDNDFDPDGDTIQIISFGADTTADGDGWFDWQDGSNGGELRLNVDGAFQFRDLDGDFEELASEQSLETSLGYQISDGNGGSDTASITFEIEGDDCGCAPPPFDPFDPMSM